MMSNIPSNSSPGQQQSASLVTPIEKNSQKFMPNGTDTGMVHMSQLNAINGLIRRSPYLPSPEKQGKNAMTHPTTLFNGMQF